MAPSAIPISTTELLKRTAKEFQADNCLGLAAQLAFYFLLALVPAIAFVVALMSFFPQQMIQQMLGSVGAVAPDDMMQIIRGQVTSITEGEHTGVLTVGFLLALWSSSAAVVAITDALNRAYDIEEGRPWWKVRLTAILLTLALAILVVLAFGLILVGPTLAEWLAAHTGMGPVFEWTWKILQWPIVFALVVVALALVNYFGPDAEQEWSWVSPGAVLATVLWLVASLAFKFYVANFASYNDTYGSLGGVVVLMMWFYLTGIAVLAGAEMNAEIEHASPYGKDAGEKVPGQKKRIRAREDASQGEARPAPSPQPFAPQPVNAPAGTKLFPALPLLLTRWWFRRRRLRD